MSSTGPNAENEQIKKKTKAIAIVEVNKKNGKGGGGWRQQQQQRSRCRFVAHCYQEHTVTIATRDSQAGGNRRTAFGRKRRKGRTTQTSQTTLNSIQTQLNSTELN